MPDPSAPRRRFHLLRWSLFGLALVGLGFLLNDQLGPRPRCELSFPAAVTIESISWDGTTIVTLAAPAQVPITGVGFPQVGPFQVWNTRSGTLVGTHLQDKWLQDWTCSPSQRRLGVWEWHSVEDGGLLYLIDLASQDHKQIQLKEVFEGHLHFSPQENLCFFFAFAGPHNKEVSYLLETATGKVLNTFKASAFHGFLPDDSRLLYGIQNGESVDLHIWDTRMNQLAHVLPNASKVTLSPDGLTVAAIIPAGWIFMDLKTFETRSISSATKAVLKALFSPNGRTLAILGANGRLELWDVATSTRRLGQFKINKNSDVSSILFSPDSTFLCVIFSDPNVLTLWDVSSGALLWTTKMPSWDHPLGAAFTSDSRFLATHQDEEPIRLHVMEPRTGKLDHILSGDVWPIYRFPNNLRFLTSNNQIVRQPHILEKLLGDWWPGKTKTHIGEVRMFDVAQGTVLARLESESLEFGVHSEDGRTLVTSHKENGKYLLRCWDLPLRPPLLLVIGIPLGLGMMVLLFSRWRARRKVRREAVVASVMPNPLPMTAK